MNIEIKNGFSCEDNPKTISVMKGREFDCKKTCKKSRTQFSLGNNIWTIHVDFNSTDNNEKQFWVKYSAILDGLINIVPNSVILGIRRPETEYVIIDIKPGDSTLWYVEIRKKSQLSKIVHLADGSGNVTVGDDNQRP